MSDVIQLNISIQHSEPLIFRTVQVKKETTFFELHHIIQIVMGWQNYHLFEFNLDGYRVAAFFCAKVFNEFSDKKRTIKNKNDLIRFFW